MNAPCSAKTIRRNLNDEKIMHKKRIHRPRLTMKQKEEWLKYAHQYQTTSAKKWWKVVLLDKKKFNLDGPDGFQKYWHAKNFPKQNYSTSHSRGESLSIWGASSSSEKLKLQFVSSQQRATDYVKILRRASSMWRRMDFSARNAAIHNASITKKYLLEQKIRLLDHPTCSPIEHLRGLIVAKFHEDGW